MKKGFEFWVFANIPDFLRIYWMTYGIVYLVAVMLSILMANPFIYLLLGGMPCIIIWTYRIIHNPLYNLEDSISKCDPDFYNSLLSDINQLLVVAFLVSKRKHKQARFFSGVMKYGKTHKHKDIVTFVRNNETVDKTGTMSLTIWFFTFIFLLFGLYMKQL